MSQDTDIPRVIQTQRPEESLAPLLYAQADIDHKSLTLTHRWHECCDASSLPVLGFIMTHMAPVRYHYQVANTSKSQNSK
ncbi:MAG TPA: hypothetical protein VK155_18505 [Bacteroidales bacterium]|nr:hypothetical protein [Bacteroidales bacterium]